MVFVEYRTLWLLSRVGLCGCDEVQSLMVTKDPLQFSWSQHELPIH